MTAQRDVFVSYFFVTRVYVAYFEFDKKPLKGEAPSRAPCDCDAIERAVVAAFVAGSVATREAIWRKISA